MFAKSLALPPRVATAMSGSAFAKKVSDFPLPQREEAALAEVMSGNVPRFWRELVPITVTESGVNTNVVVYFVTPDYLIIGSDEDYFLMPLTPFTAQRIADQLDCS